MPVTDDCIHCELIDADLLVAIRQTEGRRTNGLPYTTAVIDQVKERREQHRRTHHGMGTGPGVGAAA